MADPVALPRRGLVAIVGAAAAAALFVLTPHFEGEKLTTYRDIAGNFTYCDGATENAVWGRAYTPAECKAQLDRDLVRAAEGVKSCVHVPLTDGQMVGFVDFTYNEGAGTFCVSSMARRANSGDMAGACAALSMYDKAKVGGVKMVVAGLVTRRAADRKFCEEGIKQ